VTHIINTASRDVWLPVEKLTNLGLDMFQFHVDDVPGANISALMINNHWSLARSLKKLRQSRPVKPNLGFMVQLLSLEQKLKNKGDRLI